MGRFDTKTETHALALKGDGKTNKRFCRISHGERVKEASRSGNGETDIGVGRHSSHCLTVERNKEEREEEGRRCLFVTLEDISGLIPP